MAKKKKVGWGRARLTVPDDDSRLVVYTKTAQKELRWLENLEYKWCSKLRDAQRFHNKTIAQRRASDFKGAKIQTVKQAKAMLKRHLDKVAKMAKETV
jgi:hypothetical protein